MTHSDLKDKQILNKITAIHINRTETTQSLPRATLPCLQTPEPRDKINEPVRNTKQNK